MRQVNETYENARLVEELETEGCRPFLEAVRKYASCQDTNAALKQLEILIWTSRAVEYDDHRLPHDVYLTLCELRERYQLFSASEANFRPTTYRLARRMILELFF